MLSASSTAAGSEFDASKGNGFGASFGALQDMLTPIANTRKAGLFKKLIIRGSGFH
jgi:hypothetical protein